MELRDLTHDEQLALVALIEYVVTSNRDVTDEEIEEIADVAAALGHKRYRNLVEEADERFEDDEGLKEHLGTIDRQEARELIYGVVLETALSDPEMLRNGDFLDWLRDEWRVPVDVEPGPS